MKPVDFGRSLLSPILTRITLSSAPFYASLVVVTSLSLFIGAFWAVNEYQAYRESVENIRNNYQHQYEVRVKEELEKVVDFIDFRRSQNAMRVERDIRERVQSAYTIASHLYRFYKDEKSVDELRSMVAEILRPIRWNNGRGYYFAGRIGTGRIDLFSDEPFFENKTAVQFKKITGQDLIGDIITLVREKGAGLYRYNLVKPKFSGKSFGKIAFVKHFEPFDWFIGAGMYTDDLEWELQQDILDRLQNMKFGKDGEVFGFRFDGTIICNRDRRLIGRSIKDLVGSDGQAYGLTFLEVGRQEAGGYVSYAVDRGQESSRQKLGYIKKYGDWNWILGTSMFMDAMEKAIAAESETYQRISFENVFIFIILYCIAVSFLLLSTFFYSLKIREGISLFIDFFRQAADSNVKIRNESLTFREFEDLGRLANIMVENRIKNELLLHRDELRLDTLLRLGMMEQYSLQEKYDFVLRRIVQITRSEEGYLCLVKKGEVEIRSLVFLEGGDSALKEDFHFVSRPIGSAGLPGQCLQKKSAVIVNQEGRLEDGEKYPYNSVVIRHLDVPIFNDGAIVLVAGVCNNLEPYDNSDVRQMTMLLEGMWLHVLKKRSEEELARLERQIIAVSEEERSNIGRNLHDDLGSHLTGVELLSKVLQQKLEKNVPEMAEQVEMIRNLIRDAIEKTRRLSRGLYPVHVVEYGLESAVEELMVEVESLFHVQCVLSCEDEGEKLQASLATHLYYIIREAVFNAARHGKPEHIGVFMEFAVGRFSVKIVDDGHGFGWKPKGSGMGFHTMKYRAKAIGAELTIDSDTVRGTIVSVSGEVFE
ncbi:cache domain-containing protein [Desulfomarina sp.]